MCYAYIFCYSLNIEQVPRLCRDDLHELIKLHFIPDVFNLLYIPFNIGIDIVVIWGTWYD